MTARRDDDAFAWEGDDDPTLDVGSSTDPAASGEPRIALPDGFTAVGRGSEAVSAGADTGGTETAGAEGVAESAAPAPAEAAPLGSGALIALGVLGGVYALYAIGWIIGGLRLQGWRPFLVTDAMYQGSLWLAVLAPLLWFATVFLLTRGARAWVRLAWLAAGVVLLVPWPFVLIGAVGQ